jgi:hypothetical protein
MTAPLHRLIESRNQFHEALREGFAEMARTGCREAWISDDDFADWPLNERAVVESLTQWAMSHRKLVVLARHYDEVVRRHARWVEWRRQWSHVVECRAFAEAQAGEIPTLLLASDLLAVRLVDPERHRGAIAREAADLLRIRESIDAVSQRSVESFPATLLGL